MPSITAVRVQSGTGLITYSTSSTATSGTVVNVASGTTVNTTLSLITPSSGVQLYDSLTQSTTASNNITLALRNLVAGSNITITSANGLITIASTLLTNNVNITGGAIALTGFLTASAAAGVIAHPGGGQGSATALAAQVNRVATVATAGDSVALPAASAGLAISVVNSGANVMQVYGAGTDTINGVATATGVPQMVNSMVTYTCPAAGVWVAESLGTGYASGLPTLSFANSIAAFAGGGQSSATQLTSCINRVTTVTNAADSVKLPQAVGGLMITVSNAHASNSLNVFPFSGDAITTTNTQFALAAGKTATFTCAAALQWSALLSS